MLLKAVCYQGTGSDLRKEPSAYLVAQIFICASKPLGGLSMVSKEHVPSGSGNETWWGGVESKKVRGSTAAWSKTFSSLTLIFYPLRQYLDKG